MSLLTRQQAVQSWAEPDPAVQFGELLDALEHYKDISTEYGLNLYCPLCPTNIHWHGSQ